MSKVDFIKPIKIVNPVWDVFSKTIFPDTSIKRYQFEEFKDKNILNLKDATRYEIVLQDLDNFSYPADSYIQVKLRIFPKVRDDDNDIFDTGEIALQNCGYNLFLKAKLKFNDNVIEDIQEPGYAMLIYNLLEYSGSYEDTSAENQFWYIDEGDLDADQTTNEGFRRRKRRGTDAQSPGAQTADNVDRQISLFLPINRLFRIFSGARQHAWRGIKMTIELEKNIDNDMLFRDDLTAKVQGVGVDLDGTVVISHLSWWVPFLMPNLATETRLNTMLNSGLTKTLKWNQLRTYLSPTFQPTDVKPLQFITTTGHKPVRAVTAILFTADLDDQKKNNMVFQDALIRTAKSWINSVKYPDEEYVASFGSLNQQDASRLHQMAMIPGFNSMDMDSGTSRGLEYTSYVNTYPIIVFDYTYQNPGIFKEVTTANLQVQLELEEPPEVDGVPQQYKLITVVEFEREIGLTGLNNRLTMVL